MLPAVIIIGACVLVLAALCGLVAFAFMLRNRIKVLFKAFEDCGLTVVAARDGLRAIVADTKTRPGSYLLGAAMFVAFALFAEYIMLGLVALGTLGTLLFVIGRWSGFERLAGYASVPLFPDESRHAPRDGAKAAG